MVASSDENGDAHVQRRSKEIAAYILSGSHYIESDVEML